MKKTKKQMVISALLTGREMTSKDIAKILSEQTGENVTIQSTGAVLSGISDKNKCDLGYFINKNNEASPNIYKMVPEALALSEDQAYGLTLKKSGGNQYSLEQALKDFPGLKKYTAAPSGSKKDISDSGNIYQIKITLKNSRPPIWRKIQVTDNTALDELHDIIQTVMGWDDYHLHQFIIEGEYYGEPDPTYLDDMEDEKGLKLSEIVSREKYKFMYEYDFGDGWLHEILVEKILPLEKGKEYPVCISGKRACPPEDVGGVWGYEAFVEAITDKKNPEHEEMLDWVGGSFDPEEFDIDAVNRDLGVLLPVS